MAGAAIVAFWCAGLLTACGRPTPAGPENVTVTTSDGWTLPGVLYLPAKAAPPGLICLHRYGASHDTWAQFASRAMAMGYAVIALDLRGHGESRRTDGAARGYRDLDARGWKPAVADVRAAKQALLEAGAAPGDLALVGEGLGASIALHYAVLDETIQAVVALSPQLETGGIKTEPLMARLARRPVLIAAAEDDAAAYTAGTVLDQAAGGFCEWRVYPGSAQGSALFAVNQNALELTLQWLRSVTMPAE